MQAVRVAGQVFQDTIDGYFPLQTALRHLMQRRGFGAAWIRLLHAPILHMPDLPPEAPVPVYLKTAEGGMLHHLSLLVICQGDNITLSGAGRWSWNSTHAPLSGLTRLGEPAFLRGIGLSVGGPGVPIETALFGPLTRAPHSDVAYTPTGPMAETLAGLGWDKARLWQAPPAPGEVTYTDGMADADMANGRLVGADTSCHLIRPGLLTRAAPKDPARLLAQER